MVIASVPVGATGPIAIAIAPEMRSEKRIDLVIEFLMLTSAGLVIILGYQLRGGANLASLLSLSCSCCHLISAISTMDFGSVLPKRLNAPNAETLLHSLSEPAARVCSGVISALPAKGCRACLPTGPLANDTSSRRF